MRLAVIGTGYVGLVTGACFAEMGNAVVCVDRDGSRIASLQAGRVPFHEPGLSDLVMSNQREGRLKFSISPADAIPRSSIQFIAVGTPSNDDGSADLSSVLEVARTVGRHVSGESVVVTKSTVPVGTADAVQKAIQIELSRRGVPFPFYTASNPEFLKEGSAVSDFMRPERIIIGSESDVAIQRLRELYAPFTRNHDRLIVMGLRDAEMTKYAANAMLATRISFMNEIAAVCETLGVDVENVRRGIGSDSRIGHSYIYPGCGYGGSCLPKDVRALIRIAETNGTVPGVLRAVASRNDLQKQVLFEKICNRFGKDLVGSTFAIWGLSFKAGTDDVREAPSVILIERLIATGAQVRVYDPVAAPSTRRALSDAAAGSEKLLFCDNQYDAVNSADALVLVTEWKPFRRPDFDVMNNLMRTKVIIDGRNQYDPKQVKLHGFEYYGVGR